VGSHHCFANRVNPESYYLYPNTLSRYLISEGLRRHLGKQIWDLDENDAGYAWTSKIPANAPSLRTQWLDTKNWDGNFPWVFIYIDSFNDPNELQKTLLLGGGPRTSGGFSSVEQGDYLKKQGELIRAQLDAWIADALNGAQRAMGEHWVLGAVINVLTDMDKTFKYGLIQAQHLEEYTSEIIVRDEAALASQLAFQASTEIKACLTRLNRLDQILGEGKSEDHVGLCRSLDLLSGQLREELDKLMGHGHGGADKYVRFPLTWEKVEKLGVEHAEPKMKLLLDCMQWEIIRNSSSIDIRFTLHVDGDKPITWTLSDLWENGNVESLRDSLLQTGVFILPHGQWRINDLTQQDQIDKPIMERTRQDSINEDAKALYLLQNGELFTLPSHASSQDIDPADIQEGKAICIEANLSTRHVWFGNENNVPPPFVFDEEYYAYRAYTTYCRVNNIMVQPLPPALVGLCHDQNSFLKFAMAGLGENKITSVMNEGRNLWIVNLESGQVELCESDDNPETNFIETANAWVRSTDPALRNIQAVGPGSMDQIEAKIIAHPLITGMSQGLIKESFLCIVKGILLVEGIEQTTRLVLAKERKLINLSKDNN